MNKVNDWEVHKVKDKVTMEATRAPTVHSTL